MKKFLFALFLFSTFSSAAFTLNFSSYSDFFEGASLYNISIFTDQNGSQGGYINKYSFNGSVPFSNINSSKNFSLNDGSLRLDYLNGLLVRSSVTNSFTTTLGEHAGVVWNSRIYLFGGKTSSGYYLYPQFGEILANGSILWKTSTDFINERNDLSAVVWNGNIYVVGGFNSSSSTLRSVERTQVFANGSIGAFVGDSPLAEGRRQHASVVWNGRVYVLGGINPSSVVVSSVQYADILANGSLYNWRYGVPMQTARNGLSAVVWNNRIYVFSGSCSGFSNVTVESAGLLADGNLTSWRNETSFIRCHSRGTSVVWNGRVYVLGDGSDSRFIEGADILANGSLGEWRNEANLTDSHLAAVSVVWNGNIYTLGHSFGGSYTNVVDVTPIASNYSISQFVAGAGMLRKRGIHGAAVWNNNIYVVGGYDSSVSEVLNSVERSFIYSNGSYSNWVQEPNLTIRRYALAAIASNSRLYAIGGYNGSSYFQSVESAEIFQNGSISSWRVEAPLNLARNYLAAVVWNGRIYAGGGFNGSTYLNSVESALILDNGSVGSWRLESPMQFNRSALKAIVWNGRVYAMGGYNGTHALNFVESAPIFLNGSLGAWRNETFLENIREAFGVVVWNNKIYIAGGDDVIVPTNSTQSIDILANGTLASWKNESQLLASRFAFELVVWNGRVYALGSSGSNSTESALIQRLAGFGNFSSKVVDFNSSYKISQINWTAWTNNGSIAFTYRASNNASNLSSWSTPASASDGLNSLSVSTFARYLQYAFVFNQSGPISSTEWSPEVYDVAIEYSVFAPIASNVVASASSANYSPVQFYQFNSTWSATNGISTVLFEFNYSNGTVINFTALNLTAEVYSWNFTGLQVGNYTYRWYSNDTLGNFSSTGLFNLTVLADVEAPKFVGEVTANDSAAGFPAMFSILWTDNSQLAAFIFSTNNSGTWINSTVNFSGTSNYSNFTIVLNSTPGLTIGYKFFSNDTSGNMNSTALRAIVLSPRQAVINSNFYLQANTSANGTAFLITGNNVIFDGNGLTVNGNGSGFGIIVNGSNIIIRNLTLSNFSALIFLNGTSNVSLQNVFLNNGGIALVSNNSALTSISSSSIANSSTLDLSIFNSTISSLNSTAYNASRVLFNTPIISSSTVLPANVSFNGSAFVISGNNIVFDGLGFTISGNGSGFGIIVNGNNITIRNISISNFSTLLLLNSSSNVTLQDVFLMFGSTGILVNNSNAVSVSGVSISNMSTYDIYVSNTSGFTISNSAYNASMSFFNQPVITATTTLPTNVTANGTGFTIVGNNIALNGNGFALIGNGSGTAIVVNGSNVVISNLTVMNFSNAINASNAQNLTLIGVNLIGSGFGNGIQLYNTTATISNSSISNFSNGIVLNASSNSSLNNVFISTSQNGLVAFNSSFVTVSNSNFSNNTVAVSLNNSNSAILNFSIIQNASIGIVLSGSNSTLIANTIISASSFDISISNSFNTTLLNSNFNKSDVKFGDLQSSLVVKWLVDTRLQDSSGSNLSSASLSVYDNFTSIVVASNVSDSSGLVQRFEAVEYTQNGSQAFPANVTFYTPHAFTASKAGYNSNSSLFNINQSRMVGFNSIFGTLGNEVRMALAATASTPSSSSGGGSGTTITSSGVAPSRNATPSTNKTSSETPTAQVNETVKTPQQIPAANATGVEKPLEKVFANFEVVHADEDRIVLRVLDANGNVVANAQNVKINFNGREIVVSTSGDGLAVISSSLVSKEFLAELLQRPGIGSALSKCSILGLDCLLFTAVTVVIVLAGAAFAAFKVFKPPKPVKEVPIQNLIKDEIIKEKQPQQTVVQAPKPQEGANPQASQPSASQAGTSSNSSSSPSVKFSVQNAGSNKPNSVN